MTTFWESYDPLIPRWIPLLSFIFELIESHLVLKQQFDSLNGSRAGLWDCRRASRYEEVLRETKTGLRAALPAARHLSLLVWFLVFLFQVTGPRWWMMALDRGLAELWRSSSALQGCLCLTDPRFRHRCPPKSPKYREGITVVVVVVVPLLLLHPREDQGPPKRHNGHSKSRYQAYSGAELQQLVKVKKWSKEPTVYSLPSISSSSSIE